MPDSPLGLEAAISQKPAGASGWLRQMALAESCPKAVFFLSIEFIQYDIEVLIEQLARCGGRPRRGFWCLVQDRPLNILTPVTVTARSIRAACRAALAELKAENNETGPDDGGFTVAQIFDLQELRDLQKRLKPR